MVRQRGRRSIRLQGYDYTQAGAYFVTICTQDRECLFGQVVGGEMVLNTYGRVIATFWQRSPRHSARVELDEWVVMPNHVHGIIVITGDVGRGEASPGIGSNGICASPFEPCLSTSGASRDASPLRGGGNPAGPPSGSLGAIVGNFKSVTTRRINRIRKTPGARVWQRNYYERVIRDERGLNAVRRYIRNNPGRWSEDRENPAGAVDPARAI
jgi:putative transposase